MAETPSLFDRLAVAETPPVAAEPVLVVIFGGAGDLVHRKLLPALYNLHLDGLLPPRTSIVGVGRKEFDDDKYRAFAKDGIEKFSRRPIDEHAWPTFADTLFFVNASIDDTEDRAFAPLGSRLDIVEHERGLSGNRIYYLAVPPALFVPTVRQLNRARFVPPRDQATRDARPYARQLLRAGGRAARHGPESHAAVAVDDRHGAAALARVGRGARREARSAAVASANRGRSGRRTGRAGPVRRGIRSWKAGLWLSPGAWSEPNLNDRNVRRAPDIHRQLAVGRRAVFHPYGQTAAETRERDFGAPQRSSADPVQCEPERSARSQRAVDSDSAR